jgi:hypothetical protein
MFAGLPFLLANPSACAVAGIVGIPAIAMTFLRRRLGIAAVISVGTILLIAAAGEPSLMIPSDKQVAVMVDLSPSARNADYRQLDILRRRVNPLLGDTPHLVVFFSDRNKDADLFGAGVLNERPSPRTLFAPPPCNAVLLFSDGQFAKPGRTPPVYPVLDTALENASDASVISIRREGNQISVSVANDGQPRTLTLHGMLGRDTETVQGNQTIRREIDPKAASIWARLSPGDSWPENDALSLLPAPPAPTERWWIGTNPPDGWRGFSSDQIPTTPTDYLAPSVIVLNNISAASLPILAQNRLQQYVRDLGGSLILFGGDASFACGGYTGTVLDSLSPLSSSAPAPQTQWIILADASGSMSQSLGNSSSTRWDKMTESIVSLLPHLPLADPFRVGQFSDGLHWWSDGKSGKETASLHLPPPDAMPHGPTNLQPVLEALAATHCDMPRELILLTDADTIIDDESALSRRLSAAHIRMHLLAIDRGSGLAALQDIVRDTGGSFITQLDFRGWAESIQLLLTRALPDPISNDPATVQFVGPAHAIFGSRISPVNSVWPKPETTAIAMAGDKTLGATWRNGAGQCAAFAFAPTEAQQNALTKLLAQPPRDPRLKVTWQFDSSPRVIVDAVDGHTFLNKLDLQLDLWDQQSVSTIAIPQTAPGRYELELPFTARPSIATVRHDDIVLDRTSLSGGYDEEFARIGENRAALEALATASGGRVIAPTETSPIDFDWPPRHIPITPWLAALGSLLIAAGLVLERRSPRGSVSVLESQPAH